MKNNWATTGIYLLIGFFHYGLLGTYLPWIMSVLKDSGGTMRIDARELLVIYPLSCVGLVLILSAARKKFIQWFERTPSPKAN